MARQSRVDLDSRPILVFWESTKACSLACRHCRAEAIPAPPPGELSHEEALGFLESLAGFGRPRPVLVVTGGDAMMREDLLTLLDRAQELRLPVAMAPSVTPTLLGGRLAEIKRRGVKVASISLDGACAETHEGIRGVEGHFASTLAAIRALRANGFVVQVNTVAMRENVDELPAVARIVRDSGASIWEVFFLVQVGRGTGMEELAPEENEDVCHFLYDASHYGFIVRTVEAPFFRRVAQWRREGAAAPTSALYRRLSSRLGRLLGEPAMESRAQTKGTRDGKGIVFVSNKGDVYPAGFLPVAIGNIKEESIVGIYRESPLLRDIRAARFSGRCGGCEYRDLCGGSRARAFAASGDPLAEDPGCPYVPGSAAVPAARGRGARQAA